MAIVREHPKTGLDMVESGALASLAKVCIIGHHERLDGRGYPNGRGADLHENAQIAGIADVYDAVSSMRVYQARRPTHEAWELVMSLAGTAFPLELVKIFKGTVAPYPEGVAVQLSDGRRGIVAKVHARVRHPADGADDRTTTGATSRPTRSTSSTSWTWRSSTRSRTWTRPSGRASTRSPTLVPDELQEQRLSS